jgi:DNA transformation protein
MPRASRLLAHVLDLLEPLGGVDARGMFGGWGLHRDGRMFGLVIEEALFFKTDARSAATFEAAGGRPFTYGRSDGRTVATSYWAVPEGALESPEDLQPWAERGLAAAGRAQAKRAAPKRPAPKRAAPKRPAPKRPGPDRGARPSSRPKR